MAIVVGRAAVYLIALVFQAEVFANNYDDEAEMRSYGEEESVEIIPYVGNDKYIQHIHSMINAYRDDILDRRMVIETNAMVDTKYKTWKRNGDLINSLLALPKGMNDAGR